MKTSNFTDIFKAMQTKFPVEECTEKDEKEEAIYNSNNEYLCLILDKRFKNNMELRIMKPYIWVGDDTKQKEFKGLTGYAWIDKDGNYIDNFENPVHGYCWDEFVIGFVPYEDKNNEDLKLWDLVKKGDEN